MKIENRYHYLIKKPTQEKINELACEIARAEGMHSKIIFTLIRWPSWVSPPSWDLLEPYCHLVIEFREKAKAQLMKEWAEQPRLRIKRYKKIKLRNRKRYWTRRPTKYGQSPPPRRQGYIPPIYERVERIEGVEVITEESSTKRPSRRDWRILLFERIGEPKTAGMKGSPPKTLFDNRIEVTLPGFPVRCVPQPRTAHCNRALRAKHCHHAPPPPPRTAAPCRRLPETCRSYFAWSSGCFFMCFGSAKTRSTLLPAQNSSDKLSSSLAFVASNRFR